MVDTMRLAKFCLGISLGLQEVLLGSALLLPQPSTHQLWEHRPTSRRRTCLGASGGGGGGSSADLAARLAERLAAAADPTVAPPDLAAPQIRYSSELDLGTARGAGAYTSSSARWHQDALNLLKDYAVQVERCSALGTGAGDVGVNWCATWAPDSTAQVAGIAAALGCEIERFEAPFDQMSKFSARALLALLWTAATTGKMRLPGAVIRGRAVLTFDLDTGLCTAHRETLDLMAEADTGRIQNRLSATSLATFLDVCRRPDDVAPEAWEKAVRERALDGVSGTAFVDIQPNESDSEGAIALLFFGVLSALSLTLTAGIFLS